MKKILIIALFLFIQPHMSYAQTAPEKKIENPMPPSLEDELGKAGQYDSSRFFKEFLNMLFALGLIIGALFLMLYLFKRYLSTRAMQMNDESDIKVMEQRALSAKSSLYLIEFAGQTLLIAESPSGVQLLSKGAPFSMEK